MPNQELLDYIKESKKTGQTDEQIKSVLIANGWQEADINNGFRAVISPRKTVSKKNIFIALAIFILLVGGLSVYYYNSTKQTEEINISNWQTFSNQAIQFRYPNNWAVDSSEINPDGFRIFFKEGDINHGTINFKVKSRISPNNLADYAKKWEETNKNLGNNIYNKQIIAINGHDAIQYDSTFQNQDGLFYYGTAYIDFEDYIIHGSLDGQEKSLTNISHTIYNSMNFLNGKAVQPKVESSINISTWKQFSNDYLDFRYPEDWIMKGDKAGSTTFVIVSSADESTKVSFMFNKLAEMRKDITDWYVFSKSLESGTVSNERDIKIDNLTFKAYEVAGTIGKYTATTLVTQNYLYYFNFTPNISNDYLSKIVSTVKIKLK